MRWQDDERAGNVEDRRGLGPAHIGGGMGLGLVVLALVGYFVFHIDPREILAAGTAVVAPSEQQEGVVGSPTDPQGMFADAVSTSVNKAWEARFKAEGRVYEKPTLVLYDQATVTACGFGQAAMGPFYCPEDRKVYLDLGFFRELKDRFGAPGDFARAYVIAHEVGHHIQTLEGITDRAQQAQQAAGTRTGANRVSIQVELQADCYAGVWAKSYAGTGHLEPGDIKAALAAASAVGDDTIQRQTEGQVTPDSFTHGTAAQRTRWFTAGYQSGDPKACDTFSGGV